MQEVTLESLAKRVELLERALDAVPGVVRGKDWRRVVGMFTGSELQRQVDAEGQALREAERAEAQASGLDS